MRVYQQLCFLIKDLVLHQKELALLKRLLQILKGFLVNDLLYLFQTLLGLLLNHIHEIHVLGLVRFELIEHLDYLIQLR